MWRLAQTPIVCFSSMGIIPPPSDFLSGPRESHFTSRLRRRAFPRGQKPQTCGGFCSRSQSHPYWRAGRWQRSQQGLSARVVGTVCLRSEKLRRAAAVGTSESHVMIAYAHFVLGHHLISRPQEDTHMTESKTTSVWFYLD